MIKIPQRLFNSDSGGGSTKNQTQTSTTAPYPGAQPMIDESLKAAQNLYQSGGLNVQSYGGQMVAPTAPATQQSWDAITQQATSGGQLPKAANDWAANVLSPGYLQTQSPGLSGVLDNARNAANAQISLAGRQGSGSHSAAVAGALAPIEYQDYGNKMALQAQVAGMSPQLNASNYYDAQQLAGVGSQQQAQLQDQINAQMQKYYADQSSKANELALYQQLIGGNYGGTSQVTGPVQKSGGANPWLQGAGVLASAAGSYFGSGGSI
jgi:hypothetical protein